MKSKMILWPCLVLGVVAVAILWWPRQPPVAARPAPPTSLPAPPEAETTVHRQPSIAIPTAAPPARETGFEETRAAVQAKLRQWLGTETGDTETQEALTQELLALLTAGNVAEIILSLSPEELHTPFGTGALERWLKTDAAEASRWLAERPDATEEHALLVARRLLDHPVELQAYCDQLPEGAWKQNVLDRASQELVSADPVAAIALAQQMAAGDTRTNALETIAYAWFGREPDAAARWTQTVEDPQLRERLLAVSAKAIATTAPDLAAVWLVLSVQTEEVRNETALTLIGTWASRQPAQAAGWAARFSDAGPRKTAIDLVLNHWLESDPPAANAWLQNLPERDAILARLKTEQAERERQPDME